MSLDVTYNGMGDAGTLALTLGKALRARVRVLPATGFRLGAVHLKDCWEDLGLPKAGREWSNEEVLAFFDEQEKRAIAFAMASHARLGQESSWSGLRFDADVCSMIMNWSAL